MRREDLRGTWAMQREAEWPSTQRDELVRQALAYGLESADSIRDRSISLFERGRNGYSGGCRFMLESRWTVGPPFVLVPVGDPRLSGVSRCLGLGITHRWASISWNRSTWWMSEM